MWSWSVILNQKPKSEEGGKKLGITCTKEIVNSTFHRKSYVNPFSRNAKELIQEYYQEKRSKVTSLGYWEMLAK